MASWGGAALMAVEYAPVDKRSFFGSFPQIGTPLGMILATGALWGLTTALGKQAMIEWGWRIPFLFSVVLIVGRRGDPDARIEESPVFKAMRSAPQGVSPRHCGTSSEHTVRTSCARL